MKYEIREDSVVIDGYVNVTQRDSKEMRSINGKFVEQVRPNTFDKSLHRNDNVKLLLNHNEQRELGNTKDNVQLNEDVIGLRCIATITDSEVISKAKNN